MQLLGRQPPVPFKAANLERTLSDQQDKASCQETQECKGRVDEEFQEKGGDAHTSPGQLKGQGCHHTQAEGWDHPEITSSGGGGGETGVFFTGSATPTGPRGDDGRVHAARPPSRHGLLLIVLLVQVRLARCSDCEPSRRTHLPPLQSFPPCATYTSTPDSRHVPEKRLCGTSTAIATVTLETNRQRLAKRLA